MLDYTNREQHFYKWDRAADAKKNGQIFVSQRGEAHTGILAQM